VVEVPPGPPVLSPIVAEIYGPDYAGQVAVAKEIRKAFEGTADIVGVDDSVQADAQEVRAARRAEQGGAAGRGAEGHRRGGAHGPGRRERHAGALADAKYEIPVRVTLAPEKQGSLDALLKLTVRARDGRMVPVSELVEVREALREKAIYRKDLLPVVYVTGDMGGKLDSPLYGMFDIRSKVNGMALDALPNAGGTLGEYFIRQPKTPTPAIR
jgi:multidrug efflux pump subunit AcrB